MRQAWLRGRSRFVVWALRVNSDAIRDRAMRVLTGLGSWVIPQSLDQLHVTVFVAGFPAAFPSHDDDIHERALALQAQALRHRRRGPVAIEVQGTHSFLSVPVLKVGDPHGSLAELRERLSAHAVEVRFSTYYPHVTLGRYSETLSTRDVATRLRALGTFDPIPLRCEAIELVSLDGRSPDSPLETVESVTL